MHKHILFASTAAIFALTSASYAQTERRDTQSPPAATGSQSEQAKPDSDNVREPQAGEQRSRQPGSQKPSRAQKQPAAGDQKQAPSQAQSPRSGQRDEPAKTQRPTQDKPGQAQDKSAPQQPSAQSPTRDNQPSSAQAPADSRQGAQTQVSAEQRTQINQTLSRTNVNRVASANFNVSIGTSVPRSVRFVPLPAGVVSIVPQYRGYHYAVVRDEIVIIEPGTRRVVYVMPYGSRSQAVAPTKRKVTLSQSNRDFVRRNVKPRQPAQTTGSATTTTEITIGETLPETVVIERFPDTVYRRVPALRSYQYLQRDDDIYLVDRQRRVIELMD